MIPINSKNINALPKTIEIFDYDRGSLLPKILHVGVGKFHRSHQAYVFNQACQIGLNYGIVGLNLLPDPELEKALKSQDMLYTVTELDSDTNKTSLIGSLLSLETDKTLDSTILRKIELVTCTITQDGYYADFNTRSIKWADIPDINIYKVLAIVASLAENNVMVISCDNIPWNSNLLRNCLYEYLQKKRPDLLKLVDDRLIFLNSVVDRITPSITPEYLRFLNEKSIHDRAPVFCESYLSWIIEKQENHSFENLQRVPCLRFVDDIEFHQNLKLRIFNLSHFALGLLGISAGIFNLKDVLLKDEFRVFIEKLIFQEIIPGLNLIDNEEAFLFAVKTIQRFLNPHLVDTCSRVTRSSQSKINNLLVPVLENCRKNRIPSHCLEFLISLWAFLATNGKIDVASDNMESAMSLIQAGFFDEIGQMTQYFQDLHKAPVETVIKTL
ncbi:MAG: hypothetical protein NZT61_04600 [Deltaproteobacteria bacterium]|nr:hypothetical protein [Deltaproteobacteria bacterium]